MELTPLPTQSPLAPTAQEVALLTAQYHKALDGLYEAYRFGMMLLQVKARLESDPHGSPENQGFSSGAARGTAREVTIGKNGNALTGSGWNAGMGLKGWLAEHCPEINYSTARRFLSVAEKTNLALGEEANSDPLAANGSACEPCEQAVRAYLEGKSQRAVLRLGGKREGAGRPRKDWSAALGEGPLLAMKRIEEALAPLNELIVVKQAHLLLTPGDLETIRAAIDLLHERVLEERAIRGTQD